MVGPVGHLLHDLDQSQPKSGVNRSLGRPMRCHLLTWTVSLTYQEPWSQSRGERGSASVRAAQSRPPRARLLSGLGWLVLGHSLVSVAAVPHILCAGRFDSAMNLLFVSFFLLFLSSSHFVLSQPMDGGDSRAVGTVHDLSLIHI